MSKLAHSSQEHMDIIEAQPGLEDVGTRHRRFVNRHFGTQRAMTTLETAADDLMSSIGRYPEVSLTADELYRIELLRDQLSRLIDKAA